MFRDICALRTVFENHISYQLDHGQGPPEWRLCSFEHRQAFNACNRMQIEIMSLRAKPDPRELMGQRLRLRVLCGMQQQLHAGIVVSVQEGRRHRDGILATATVEPALALLGKNVDSRIFQDQSPIEIIKALIEPQLEELGSALVLFDLQRGRETRDYCVQYEESDLQFMERLLAECGINYYFDYDDRLAAERVVLFDNLQALPGADPSQELVGLIRIRHERARAEVDSNETSVDVFQREFSIVPHSISIQHWNWQRAGVESSKSERPDRFALFKSLQLSSSRRDAPQQLHQRVEDQLHAIEQGRQIGRGSSESLALVVGTRFALDKGDGARKQEHYVVKEVLHRGQCPEWLLDCSSPSHPPAANYQNDFQCFPAQHVLRPSLPSARSSIPGPQSAVVCGPRTGEVHVDPQGRIALAFSWDRDRESVERRICWVRVAQSWAGAGWGSFFVPRVGSEVLVVFLNGDPERPLVVAGLHNPTQPPPFALPGCKTQSGIKTRSTGGSAGYNELRFEDQKDREELYIKAQKTLRVQAGGSKEESICESIRTQCGGEQRLEVGGESCVEVGGNQGTLIHGELQIQCQGSCKQEIGLDLVQKVEGKRLLQAASQEFEAQQGLFFRCTHGGARMDLEEDLVMRARALTLLCGECRVHVDPQKGVTLDAGSSPIRMDGESIHLNCG